MSNRELKALGITPNYAKKTEKAASRQSAKKDEMPEIDVKETERKQELSAIEYLIRTNEKNMHEDFVWTTAEASILAIKTRIINLTNETPDGHKPTDLHCKYYAMVNLFFDRLEALFEPEDIQPEIDDLENKYMIDDEFCENGKHLLGRIKTAHAEAKTTKETLADFKQLKDDKTKLSRQNESMQQEIDRKAEELKKLEEERDRALQDVQTVMADGEKFKAQRAQCLTEKEALEKEIETLKADATKRDNNSLAEKDAKLKKKNEENEQLLKKERECMEQKAEKDALIESIKKKLEENEATIIKLKKEVELRKETIEQDRHLLAERETQEINLLNEIELKDATIERLKTQGVSSEVANALLMEQNAKVAALQAESAARKAQVEELEQANKAKQQELDAASVKNTTDSYAISQLKKNLADQSERAAQEKDAHARSVAALKGTITKLQDNINNWEREMLSGAQKFHSPAMEQQLAEYTARIAKLQAQGASSDVSLEMLQERIDNLDELFKITNEDLDKALDFNNAAKEEIKDADQKLAAMRAERDAKAVELETLRETIAKSTALPEQMQPEIERAAQHVVEIDDLKRQIAECEENRTRSMSELNNTIKKLQEQARVPGQQKWSEDMRAQAAALKECMERERALQAYIDKLEHERAQVAASNEAHDRDERAENDVLREMLDESDAAIAESNEQHADALQTILDERNAAFATIQRLQNELSATRHQAKRMGDLYENYAELQTAFTAMQRLHRRNTFGNVGKTPEQIDAQLTAEENALLENPECFDYLHHLYETVNSGFIHIDSAEGKRFSMRAATDSDLPKRKVSASPGPKISIYEPIRANPNHYLCVQTAAAFRMYDDPPEPAANVCQIRPPSSYLQSSTLFETYVDNAVQEKTIIIRGNYLTIRARVDFNTAIPLNQLFIDQTFPLLFGSPSMHFSCAWHNGATACVTAVNKYLASPDKGSKDAKLAKLRKARMAAWDDPDGIETNTAYATILATMDLVQHDFSKAHNKPISLAHFAEPSTKLTGPPPQQRYIFSPTLAFAIQCEAFFSDDKTPKAGAGSVVALHFVARPTIALTSSFFDAKVFTPEFLTQTSYTPRETFAIRFFSLAMHLWFVLFPN